MKLSLLTLPIVIAKHLTVEAGDAFTVSARDLGYPDPDDMMDIATVGAALALAVIPDASDGTDNLPLRVVTLSIGASTVSLEPLDALAHPMLADWCPMTLAGAVAQAILGGAALTALAPGSPTFAGVCIRKFGPNEVAAAASLVYTTRTGAEARVELIYGPPPPASGLITIVQLRGDALFGIGLDSIKPTGVAHALEQDATLHVAAGAAWHGQRTWNGVAILARDADSVVTRNTLPGDPGDLQARYIEAAVNGVLIASIYLPNGNPNPGPKFDYSWLGWTG